jgi:alkylation response protein AidB-like acyl-CoA dehydrogenase
VGIAISEEHRQLEQIAQSFLERHHGRRAARDALDAETETLPPFWSDLAEIGWLGLHLPTGVGGQGGGIAELAVVVEQMGRAVAPGPFLPHCVAAALVDVAATADLRADVLPRLADGSTVATVAFGGRAAREGDRLHGDGGLVMCAGVADVILVVVGSDVAVIDTTSAGVELDAAPSLDPTRPLSRLRLTSVECPAGRMLPGGAALARRLGWTLVSAEAAGGARAATEMAAEYARHRIAFGRPIGTFGPVKHHCANMLVDAEIATATAWDAARADPSGVDGELAAAVAAAVALPAFVHCAQLDIQVHGGIGYTFEHDAHLFLRRAGAVAALFAPDAAKLAVTDLTRAGVRRAFAVDLPREAEAFRRDVREFVARYTSLPADERRAALVESGYFVPHWPPPWGRGASAIEQLVIDEEFAGIDRPAFAGSPSWITLTIATYGTDDQKERFIRPTLLGELMWCSLFSEPDAGSDAANVKTRARRVEGGWSVNGQKIWTSTAHVSHYGLATVRTDTGRRKHDGITAMIVAMDAPGVDVRPLRDITGGSGFNEVFFDDVFVPDDDVVGHVNDGWTVARATFGNERVSIGRQLSGEGTAALVTLLDEHAAHDTALAREVGAVLAERQAMQLMNLRQAERAVVGGPPSAEGNIGKLLAGEHSQHVADVAMRIAGPEAAVRQGEALARGAIDPALLFLSSRGLTIGGGTSEITRNQIGERLLGLPRDPLLA